MGIMERLEDIRRKHSLRCDELDNGWKTINGTHVLIDKNGEMVGGPDSLKKWNTVRKGAAKQTGGSMKKAAAVKKPASSKAGKRVAALKDKSKIFSFKTTNELNEYLFNRSGLSINSTVTDAMERDPYVMDLVKEACYGLEEMCKKYPDLKYNIDNVTSGNYDLVDMQSYGDNSHDIMINTSDKDVREKYEAAFGNKKTGYLPKNSSPASIVAGQCGEVMMNTALRCAHGLLEIGHKAGRSMYFDTLDNDIIEKAVSQYKEKYAKGKEKKMDTYELLGTLCGQSKELQDTWKRRGREDDYKQHSRMEAIRQSFADTYANGNDAHPLSRLIADKVESAYEDYTGLDKQYNLGWM